MNNTITPFDNFHLREIIKEEVKKNGFNCDLNHIDVSSLKDMTNVFYRTRFNGDISRWDVSNVESMAEMFAFSVFNQDISDWDVSKVKNMTYMFLNADFRGDMSEWKPYGLEEMDNLFLNYDGAIPYWGRAKDKEERISLIEKYWLKKELDLTLDKNVFIMKRAKI